MWIKKRPPFCYANGGFSCHIYYITKKAFGSMLTRLSKT
jgi:hypothetical protein